jgi:sec-independent protein translocase protein TatB
MFDISFWEISVVFVITLLVVGPEKLPGLVRDVGRVVRKLRRVVTQTRYELEREFSFEEERRRLNQGKKGLDDAMDELDDLMNIAPDKDDPQNPANLESGAEEQAESDTKESIAAEEPAPIVENNEDSIEPAETQKSDS